MVKFRLLKWTQTRFFRGPERQRGIHIIYYETCGPIAGAVSQKTI